jgi:prepilin-type N-terminal cleavage/methylation domain-containing protein/prepilin-type processing-associated H-X9-DG protein
MLRKSTFRKASAFTLIELLVVIAIISILAAILFPVFARARENARRASCMSNQKQLALAFMMYTQDFDERLPAHYGYVEAGVVHSWPVVLEPYAKSRQLFFCPSDTLHNSSNAISTANVSYGYNYYYLSAQPGGPTSLAAIGSPSETLLTGDTSPNAAGYTIYYSGANMPTDIHLDGCNFSFVDGHVKWMLTAPVIATWGKTNSLWDLK